MPNLEIAITTPALLFPAISLLLVAYTNRFMALNSRIRNLFSMYREDPRTTLVDQIEALQKRVYLIRNMQAFGVSSLICCILCMFCLFSGWLITAKIVFVCSLLLMLISLGISLQEILISVHAINLELQELGKKKN